MNLLQMDKVYEELPFDNPDGGAWKQGWDVQYDQNEVLKPENKLKVCHLWLFNQWERWFIFFYSLLCRCL